MCGFADPFSDDCKGSSKKSYNIDGEWNYSPSILPNL